MADNPLLDLYSTKTGETNPMLGLYSPQGQQPQVDLGDQPKPKTIQGLAPQPQGPATPGSHDNPILIQRASGPEGQVSKQGQTVPQTDIKSDIKKTRESAVQAAAEATGVMDLRRLYSGELTPVEAMATAAPMALSSEMKGAKAIKDILSPGSSILGRAATLGIRKATGEAARATEVTRDALLPYEQSILSHPPEQRLNLIGYMEGRSKGAQFPSGVDPNLKEFADQFRNQMEIRKNLIQMHGVDAGVVEDYVTHLWKDRNKAAQFVRGYQSKEGTGRYLKERTVPTIEEGIRAGLEPVTDNPVEIAMRYVTAMDRHIGLRAFIDAGEAAGTVQKFSEFREVPEGYVKLKGMVDQQNLYAPADWARIWNNFTSKGVYGTDPAIGDAYNAFRNLSNLTTQTILSFSGYHAFAMSKEAITSDIVKGLGQIGGGIRNGWGSQILRGAKTIGAAPAAPITKYLKGRKFMNVYLGRTANAHIADIFAEAGGRGVGKGHAFDYTFAPAGSFASAWHRGWLKAEMRQAPGTFSSALKEAANGVIAAGGTMEGAKQAGRNAVHVSKSVVNLTSRVMSTTMAPLFEEYIPMLKNGAFADEFASWLEMNPQATHEQQVDYAAKLIDSIDNRFGEMIHDNIMWHTFAKQLATIGMLSYSWNLGSLRAFSGTGRLVDPRSLDPTSKKYSPNAAWVIAYPMAMAMVNGTYQYLKTGKLPESPQDLIWPQTGGTVPGFGQRGQVPQRGITPGYEKEPFGWYYNGTQELVNKANPLMRMGYQMMTNTDWKGDPIHPPDPTVPEWLSSYFNYVGHSMVPIVLGRIAQGEPPGSAQGLPEQLLGIRQGPMYSMDPNYGRGMNAVETDKWMKKLRYDHKHGLFSSDPAENDRLYQQAVAAARAKQLKYGGPQQ